MNYRDLVLKIHATPHKAVLAITGGGAEVIGELLRHGQGSNTLLEAVVPYDQKAFDAFVRGKPDKYCSPGAARDLAMAAYQRALWLTKSEPTIGHTSNPEFEKLKNHPQMEALRDRTVKVEIPVGPYELIGIGASCSLAKDNERPGREHHAFIAIQTATRTVSFDLDLNDTVHQYQARTRAEQEEFVASFILKLLADACGVVDSVEVYDFTEDVQSVGDDMARLVSGTKPVVPFDANMENRIVFPGSFHPMHDRHARIAEVVHQLTGKRVDLEVCVHNVDKPAINFYDLNKRHAHLAACMDDKPWAGTVFFTALPTFMEKAVWFKGATFVVGWDTFERISNPKYANLDDVVRTFDQQKIRFIVFDRLIDGKSARDQTQRLIHPSIIANAHIIGPDILPPVEMASSTIRKETQ